MYVKTYKELVIWQRGMELVKEVYGVTKLFPKEELYGITLQVRKAVVSIPSNIAEGYGRRSTNEFYHHLAIAYGSLLELETQLILAKDLKLTLPENFKITELLIVELSKMLNSMLLKNRSKRLFQNLVIKGKTAS